MNDIIEEPSADDDRPLTREERKELRKLLEDERRAKWLWANIRVWAGWISGAVLAIIALHEKIREFFRSLVAP